eukprot:12431436-Karenia_brevis.AAC.2
MSAGTQGADTTLKLEPNSQLGYWSKQPQGVSAPQAKPPGQSMLGNTGPPQPIYSASKKAGEHPHKNKGGREGKNKTSM